MTQKFFANNLIETATLTPSSENAQYPVSNLLDPRRTKTFRSNSNTTNLVINLGTSRDLNGILLVDPGIRSFGFLTATIELNTGDSWASPGYSQEITIDTTHGFAYAIFPTTQTFQFARLVLTNTAGFCEISKLFLGEHVDIGDLTFTYPLTFSQQSNASIQKNRLGQRFVDEVNGQKQLSGSINTMTPDEFQSLQEGFLDHASITKPVWIFFPETAPLSGNNNRFSGYYYLKDDPDPQLVAGNFWNIKLNFEEGT